MYYEFAPVPPSEALIERFYSIAGFVWDNPGNLLVKSPLLESPP